MKTTQGLLATLLAAALPIGAGAATVVDFEDVALAPDSYYFPQSGGTFSSGGAQFNHDYDTTYGSWGGWTVSNRDDRTAAGYTNQFSAFAESSDGSNQYGLAYTSVGGFGAVPKIEFATPGEVTGADFTNTTYAVLSMEQGDGFAKKFGGVSGDDPDFLVLNVTGRNATGAITGTAEVVLSDYRFDDNGQDYIVKDWAFSDLTGLGVVSSLEFSMDSSDVGQFGMNTPAYFAIDNLAVSPVPWPAAPWLFGAGLGVIGIVRKRRKTA